MSTALHGADGEEGRAMRGLRVGVEVEATTGAVTATMATLPWMAPERIALDDRRSLLLVSTSFTDPTEARAYAERRINKSAIGIGIDLRVLSTEAFPLLLDIRDPRDTGSPRLDDRA